MIRPRTLADMIERSTLERTRTAIVATLDRLLVGVTVIGHPGKLDINDVVAKAVVQAPGVAVGWTRLRAERDVDGGYRSAVEWAAYIVAEAKADLSTRRSISRETVGYAIGSTILEILDDPDTASWGLPGLAYPAAEPSPAFVPIMTMKSAENGADFYAVTWTQSAMDQGASYFGGKTPALDFVDGTVQATFDEDEDGADRLPPEIRAMMREAEKRS